MWHTSQHNFIWCSPVNNKPSTITPSDKSINHLCWGRSEGKHAAGRVSDHLLLTEKEAFVAHHLLITSFTLCVIWFDTDILDLLYIHFFPSNKDYSVSNGLRRTTRYRNGNSYSFVKRYIIWTPLYWMCYAVWHFCIYIQLHLITFFDLYQVRTHPHQTSSVWPWPGTEWILPVITFLFMDTIYQWVLFGCESS